ncbi:uncharacterized protein BO80DRAFT_19704 [Aspergillus ibericus CBS 121593]|uniref:Uncharacterized protein n=1 Tax=Aspergillus ibericus CBS 121593 TaxID=1448316 RepID=A0A395H4L4_9EURO|nr:hypothetical protein BO80DRAFT_19704 [Aspergillus ibericus CBS 121593]RAL02871.1 hypothetical protein BO80DRAFT_19704 [Aspergillus ibericus CBS 121593]
MIDIGPAASSRTLTRWSTVLPLAMREPLENKNREASRERGESHETTPPTRTWQPPSAGRTSVRPAPCWILTSGPGLLLLLRCAITPLRI